MNRWRALSEKIIPNMQRKALRSKGESCHCLQAPRGCAAEVALRAQFEAPLVDQVRINFIHDFMNAPDDWQSSGRR